MSAGWMVELRELRELEVEARALEIEAQA